MRNKLVLSLFFTFNIFIASGQNKTNDSLNTAAMVDIEVATFEYLFDNNASLLKKEASVYYVGINDSTNNTISNVIIAIKIRKSLSSI